MSLDLFQLIGSVVTLALLILTAMQYQRAIRLRRQALDEVQNVAEMMEAVDGLRKQMSAQLATLSKQL